MLVEGLTVEPDFLQLTEGNNGVIDCDEQYIAKSYKITWLFDGERDLPRDVLTRDFGKGLFVLNILSVGMEHAGKYTCVNEDTGEEEHAIVEVIGERRKSLLITPPLVMIRRTPIF